jgi:pimeloyl-ACP methyl ester carboxylesterase
MPFRQGRFTDLPELPRVAHPWYDHELRRAPVKSKHFGTVDTAYKRVGDGPPLLLVHGLMTAGYSWRYVVAPLSERFTLYVLDMVGSGHSQMVDAAYPPDALADFIGEFMDHLGIAGCPVVGNSLGGYLCMRLALRRPDAMSRLVNVHSPATAMPRFYALRMALALPGSFRLLRGLVHWDVEQWVHRNVHYYDESLKSLEEVREYAAPLRTTEGVRCFGRHLYDAMAPHEFVAFRRALEQRGAFPVPLRLVYAKTDPLVPPSVGSTLSKWIPDAELVWVDEASHFAHVDQVPGFLAALDGFL